MARLTVATCMGLAVTLGLGLGLFMRRELSALAKEYHRSAADAASAAARIRLSEDKANAILESITDGFFTLDIEWRYVYVNAAAERYNSNGDFQIPNVPGVATGFTFTGHPTFDSSKLNENQSEQEYYTVLSYEALASRLIRLVSSRR